MSISINDVLYRYTREYHQTIEDRLCDIIVLIDSSNDNACNHKSIIYLRIEIDSPVVSVEYFYPLTVVDKVFYSDPIECTQCTRFFCPKTLR